MKLILGKNRKYLVKDNVKVINTTDGKIRIKKKVAISHLGKKFAVLEPTLVDLMEKAFKRGSQVVLAKDASLILTYTGIKPNSKVVDIGGGSGFLSIFLAWYLRDGKIVAYEKDERRIKIIKENSEIAGIRNLKMKKKDVTKGISEKNLDLVTVDIKNPERIIKFVYKSLKVGGWLVVYCPVIEEILNVVKEIEKFGFSEPFVVENIVREWKVKNGTRPKTKGLMHTGFLLFVRKIE